MYLPTSGEIIAATADYNFNSYTIDSITSIRNNDNKKHILPTRQVVGCNDDILDIAFVPKSDNDDDISTTKFTVAMVTNSPQVRLMDESFSCTLLDGHSDIVLSVDASPTG